MNQYHVAGCCALVFAIMLSSCSLGGVQPWERDVLASPQMQVDRDALELTFDEHYYYSKEASSGGRSYAGAGCGCN